MVAFPCDEENNNQVICMTFRVICPTVQDTTSRMSSWQGYYVVPDRDQEQ